MRSNFDRMCVEQENIFLASLKSDLNKPNIESIVAEMDFIKNPSSVVEMGCTGTSALPKKF